MSDPIALFEAAKIGDLCAIRSFVKEGNDIEAVDADGNTVLHFAAYSGRAACVEELINYYSVDVNAVNRHNMTAIMYAAKFNHIACAKVLVKSDGIDLDVVTRNSGDTAAILAAYWNNIEVLKLLQNAGANMDIQNDDGDTAYTCAVKRSNKECVRILRRVPPNYSKQIEKLEAAVEKLSQLLMRRNFDNEEEDETSYDYCE